jgi:predicted RNase H-like HicB family nuclease
MSAQKFTFLLKPAQEGGYVAYCTEVPISCQGQTKEEALKNMKEAIESLGWKLRMNTETGNRK